MGSLGHFKYRSLPWSSVFQANLEGVNVIIRLMCARFYMMSRGFLSLFSCGYIQG